MNNHIKKQSSSSATSINLYQLLNKHFFLLCSLTYLSLITISTISWERICPQDSYSWQTTSSNSLDNHTLTLEKSNIFSTFSTWFYTFIILGCSSIPWCLAYLFRQKAYLNYQNKNTPTRELKTFESIELSVREHLLETVAPEIGNFFFTHPHFSQTWRSQSLKALCSQSLTLLI